MRAFAAVAVCAISLAGCGASEAEKALDETASNLGEIRSGQMEMKVVVSPNTAGSDIGFELEGPFSLPDEGELPTTDLRYAQIAGESRGEVRFISNRDGAWVEVDGQAYELPADRVDALIGDGGDGGGPLADLELASWARDAEVADGPSIPGEETQLVRSEIEPVEALNDLLGTLGDLGAGEAAAVGPLEGADADQLEKAVRSSTLEVLTGKEDRLLRRLTVDMDIGVEAQELAGGLGELSGAKVTLEITLADLNGAVEVAAPEGPLPYSALPSG